MTSFALRALRAYRRLETRPETPPYFSLPIRIISKLRVKIHMLRSQATSGGAFAARFPTCGDVEIAT